MKVARRAPRLILSTFAAAAVAASMSACQMQRPIARGMPPGASTVCVFGVRGVRARVTDTDDGIDVTFSLVGEADVLRTRAHAALVGGYPLSPATQAIIQRVRATVHDEPTGVTIHAKPIDPHDLDGIRDAIRNRVDAAMSDDCK